MYSRCNEVVRFGEIEPWLWWLGTNWSGQLKLLLCWALVRRRLSLFSWDRASVYFQPCISKDHRSIEYPVSSITAKNPVITCYSHWPVPIFSMGTSSHLVTSWEEGLCWHFLVWLRIRNCACNQSSSAGTRCFNPGHVQPRQAIHLGKFHNHPQFFLVHWSPYCRLAETTQSL